MLMLVAAEPIRKTESRPQEKPEVARYSGVPTAAMTAVLTRNSTFLQQTGGFPPSGEGLAV
jgi:hypothetical protein